ncbi:MAG TPA: hypothetical protein VFC99_21745 [Acidimicrobiia bacterium]|nr:hypothetical protein [Acidimicrobiia bacterium]
MEATYVVNDTHAFTVKNDGQATSEPVAIDLSGLTNAYINWVVPMDFCTGKTLAVGDTCTFLLEPHPLKYWPATTGPADLAVTAGAGVSATASITGHLTSDLKVAASNVPLVFSASAAGGGSDTMVFHIDNVSGHAVGPLNYSVTGSVGGTGMWALNTTGLGTPCQAGVSLAAGTGCDLNLVYTNNTGAGSSTGVVSIDGDDGAHASGAGIGFGTA